ncbi:MAG: hypothetical protein JJE51_05405 [Thermoanaerobaculia bacterium]|nr:hypothetical protein [Thermoanaerobaculia bacterium]
MAQKIFLLSPASLNGVRARQLMSPRAKFAAAMEYQSPEGVPIARAFAFMSALYFRGKIAYSLHFGGTENTFVITPGFGLVDPEWRITEERMKVMRRPDVDVRRRNYRKPLERDANAIASRLEEDAQVILLGSVATGKYVDVLWPILGSRLRFPGVFAGLGDMSRGGLMLRAVRENRELEYVTLDSPRSRAR